MYQIRKIYKVQIHKKVMKSKMFGLLFASFLLIMSVGLVSSANDDITIETPLDSARLSGEAQMLNATIEAPTGAIYNVTFYHNQSGSLTAIGTVTNTSDAQASFNTTFDTTSLTDVDGVIINATARNILNQEVSSVTTTGHPWDNGNPTATISSATFSDGKNVGFDETYTVGLSADSTIGISSCLVYYYNRATSVLAGTQAISASANACSASTTPESQSLITSNNYDVYVQATDGNGNQTNATSRILRVPSKGGSGGGSAGASIRTSGINVEGDTAQERLSNFFENVGDKFSNFFDKLRLLFNKN